MKILLQESEDSRIVEKKKWFLWPVSSDYIVCRQRKNKRRWVTVCWLYSFQCENIEGYIKHFNWKKKHRKTIIGKKQF